MMDFRSIPVKCRVCNSTTSHSKPYCEDHVLLMPYAKKILAEQTDVSLIEVEVMLTLENAVISFKRLARDFNPTLLKKLIKNRKLQLIKSRSKHGHKIELVKLYV